jgi:hypothetical protein
MVNIAASCDMLRAPPNPVPGATHGFEFSDCDARMAAAGKTPSTSFFGAVMSEQAVTTTEAMMAVAMRPSSDLFQPGEVCSAFDSALCCFCITRLLVLCHAGRLLCISGLLS